MVENKYKFGDIVRSTLGDLLFVIKHKDDELRVVDPDMLTIVNLDIWCINHNLGVIGHNEELTTRLQRVIKEYDKLYDEVEKLDEELPLGIK